jgi:hypothetical protein
MSSLPMGILRKAQRSLHEQTNNEESDSSDSSDEGALNRAVLYRSIGDTASKDMIQPRPKSEITKRSSKHAYVDFVYTQHSADWL